MQETWTEVVSVIAHDLKTPITSVKGYLELIQRVGPLNERQEQFSQRALNSLKQMEHLVTLLLELSWIDADRPLQCDDCDLAVLLQECAVTLEDMAVRREVIIHLEVDPAMGIIHAESRRLEQAILNLMSNAIKYNRQGGAVWVSAINTPGGVYVSVRDTGLGIRLEDQPYIFDRFFRSSVHEGQRIEGTGLGLSIVKAVIEKHGGSITMESFVGEGSTFRFLLPQP